MHWLEIFLWYTCNLKCSFCFQKDLRFKHRGFLPYEEVSSLIEQGAKDWKKSLIFSWWEATLDPNLKKYVTLWKTLWYEDIRIHSNAQNFASKELFREYIELWVSWFIFSIHGFWELHDRMVWWRPGSFQNVKKAMLNFYELKKEFKHVVLDTNTVVTKENYKYLFKLFKFFSYFPITRAQIVQLYSLYLFSKEEKKELYVKYENLVPYLYKILDIKGMNITLENFPICKLPEKYHKHIIKRQKYDNDAFWTIWEWLEESSTVYVEKCNWCDFKDVCTGFPKDYLGVFEELKN